MVVPIVSGIYDSAEADSEFFRCGGKNSGRAVDRDGAGVGTIPPSRAGRVPNKHPDRRSCPPIWPHVTRYSVVTEVSRTIVAKVVSAQDWISPALRNPTHDSPRSFGVLQNLDHPGPLGRKSPRRVTFVRSSQRTLHLPGCLDLTTRSSRTKCGT